MILSLTLVVTLTIGGSIAYLTSEDSDVNVMTLGNVQIEQHEQERVKNDEGEYTTALQPFTDNQTMLPAVYDVPNVPNPARQKVTVNGYEITLDGGMRTFPNYIDKLVTVENTGKSDAYVRTLMAFPVKDGKHDDVSNQWLHYNTLTDSDTSPWNGWYAGKTLEKGEYPAVADRNIVYDVQINGKTYEVYVATNVTKLEPGKTTGPCLAGFYLDNDVDYDEGIGYTALNNAGERVTVWQDDTVEVLVLSQAVQAQGFSDAYTALNAGYGEITEENVEKWFAEMGNKPFAKVTTLGDNDSLKNLDGDVIVLDKDLTIDTTGSKMGLDLGKISLDTAYQFEPMMSKEEGEASEYADWHADFVVSVNKDIKAYGIGLAGYYDAWCSLNNDKWVLLAYDGEIKAGEKIRLVEAMGGGSITVSYAELCEYGNDGIGFLCGAVDLSGKEIDEKIVESIPEGTTITVELRLYEATGGSAGTETGEYITTGTYSYTFK